MTVCNGRIGPGSGACRGAAGKADTTLMAEHHTWLPRVNSRAQGQQVDKSHRGISGSLKHLYIKLRLMNRRTSPNPTGQPVKDNWSSTQWHLLSLAMKSEGLGQLGTNDETKGVCHENQHNLTQEGLERSQQRVCETYSKLQEKAAVVRRPTK